MNQSDTLSGTYSAATLKMPDGSEIPVLTRKIARGDGSFGWCVIDDNMIAFEQRFKDTTTVPADHLPPNTEVLTKNSTTISKSDTAHRLVFGDLIQFLGDPDRIIANKGLDPERLAHLKAHPTSATLIRRLCLIAGNKWSKVVEYIPQYYPDRPA